MSVYGTGTPLANYEVFLGSVVSYLSLIHILSARINNIEEAVFFLGLRRIRELSIATPVIEELERLQSNGIPAQRWRELWKHSVGSAILTRELLSTCLLYTSRCV